MIIDHSGIDPDALADAQDSAGLELDNDAEAYPWLPSYPRKGQIVYRDGRLWVVGAVENGPCADEPIAMVKLNGFYRNGDPLTTVTVRCDVRPVTWTQDDEDWMGRG